MGRATSFNLIAASIVASLTTAEGTVYATENCPVVHLNYEAETVRKTSLCCGYSPENLTSCDVSDELFWTETEYPVDSTTVFPLQDFTASPSLNLTAKTNRTNKNLKKRGKYAHLYPIREWKENGWLDDSYENVINTYWMDFPPPSHQAHYVFAVVYLILAIIGLSGNLLVFTMITSFKHLRTPSNYLVANLAVADFFMMSRGPIFIYNCLHFGPVTGYIGCQVYGVVGGLTGVGAIMSLALIAKDRCAVIVHPFDPAYRLTKTSAALSISFIWLYAAIPATLPLTGSALGVKPYVPEGYLTSCSFDYVSNETPNRVFILCFFLAAWFAPFSIITSSYYKIFRHAIRAKLTRHGQERQQRKGELRLAGVLILVITVWFLSWTPYALVSLIGISGYRHLLTPFWTMAPAVFCKTAASIDPFLYALAHPRFRSTLLKVWCPKKYEQQADKVQHQMVVWRSNGSVQFRTDVNGRVNNPNAVNFNGVLPSQRSEVANSEVTVKRGHRVYRTK